MFHVHLFSVHSVDTCLWSPNQWSYQPHPKTLMLMVFFWVPRSNRSSVLETFCRKLQTLLSNINQLFYLQISVKLDESYAYFFIQGQNLFLPLSKETNFRYTKRCILEVVWEREWIKRLHSECLVNTCHWNDTLEGIACFYTVYSYIVYIWYVFTLRLHIHFA